MYQKIIKPILFTLNIEQSKMLVLWLLRVIGMLPFGRALLRANYAVESPELEREVLGLNFKNPIGLAAGFDINGDVIDPLSAMGFGFVEIGAITAEPEMGNPKPRLFRLPKDRAILSRQGLPNKGWVYAIENLRRRSHDIVIGCNLSALTLSRPIESIARDYLQSFRNLYQYVDYFTINIPYEALSGEEDSQLDRNVRAIIEPLFEFRRGQSDYRPVMVKLSPDMSDEAIDMVTDIMIETPLDGIVAVGATRNREALQTSVASLSRVGSGRISGEPLKCRAVEVVRRVHERSNGAYPIIGVGGITTKEDVEAMIEAGASLVQLYSSFIYEGPSVVGNICKGILNKQ